MNETYQDDLSDFVRYRKLDAYELTDEELAAMLEVWRWTQWMARNQPSTLDYDVIDATQRFQRHLARDKNVEVEYNTALLLKSEIEPLMILRLLFSVPRVLGYCLNPRRWWALLRAAHQIRRYQRLRPLQDAYGNPLGYPVERMLALHPHTPDLLKRRYWRQLSPYTFADRKRLDYWW
ncbi:MAG: hypothetical protein SGI73_06525 [Chloroflexota bacterium]|nr:hypothetical protein [Chloroflexota bacterium]